MRAMPTRSSNRALRIATASFVFALAAAVEPTPAFAQQSTKTPTSETEKKDKEKAEGDAAASSTQTQTQAQTEDEARKKAEAEKKSEPEEGSDALDTSVEVKKAIYVSGDVGFTRSDLAAVSDNTGLDRTVANGLLYGLGAGLRLKDLRLGLRWRVYDTTEFQLWSFALSAGYGLPLRPISPVFSAHVGYVWDQHIEESLSRRSIPPGTLLPPDVDVRGLLVGVDVNASYWVTRFLRLGVFIGADLMFLSRGKTPLPQSIFGLPPEIASNPLYSETGSAIGLNMNAGLRGAFDIGFK
jgi:hypothetical protein